MVPSLQYQCSSLVEVYWNIYHIIRDIQRISWGGIQVPGQLGSVHLDSPVRILICESNDGSRDVVEEIMAMKCVSDRSKGMLSIESADDFFEWSQKDEFPSSSFLEQHTVFLLSKQEPLPKT